MEGVKMTHQRREFPQQQYPVFFQAIQQDNVAIVTRCLSHGARWDVNSVSLHSKNGLVCLNETIPESHKGHMARHLPKVFAILTQDMVISRDHQIVLTPNGRHLLQIIISRGLLKLLQALWQSQIKDCLCPNFVREFLEIALNYGQFRIVEWLWRQPELTTECEDFMGIDMEIFAHEPITYPIVSQFRAIGRLIWLQRLMFKAVLAHHFPLVINNRLASNLAKDEMLDPLALLHKIEAPGESDNQFYKKLGKLVSLMVRMGADITKKDASGNTVLHYLVTKYHLADPYSQGIRTLMDSFPDERIQYQGLILLLCESNQKIINSVNNKGETALHIAAQYGNIVAIFSLLSCRANPKLCDKTGHTFYSRANSAVQNAIVKHARLRASYSPTFV